MNKYKIEITNKFKKDYKKMRSRNNFDDEAFKIVIEKLLNDEILPEKYCNHLLEPKTLRTLGMSHKTRLAFNIYQNLDKLILVLTRTGTHADLFV